MCSPHAILGPSTHIATASLLVIDCRALAALDCPVALFKVVVAASSRPDPRLAPLIHGGVNLRTGGTARARAFCGDAARAPHNAPTAQHECHLASQRRGASGESLDCITLEPRCSRILNSQCCCLRRLPPPSSDWPQQPNTAVTTSFGEQDRTRLVWNAAQRSRRITPSARASQIGIERRAPRAANSPTSHLLTSHSSSLRLCVGTYKDRVAYSMHLLVMWAPRAWSCVPAACDRCPWPLAPALNSASPPAMHTM